MRLSPTEISAIKQTVAELDASAKVILFGSRADDTKRGGDIDLLIMSEKLGFKEKRKIRLELFKKIGEQKIDIVIARDDSDPFVRIALKKYTLLIISLVIVFSIPAKSKNPFVTVPRYITHSIGIEGGGSINVNSGYQLHSLGSNQPVDTWLDTRFYVGFTYNYNDLPRMSLNNTNVSRHIGVLAELLYEELGSEFLPDNPAEYKILIRHSVISFNPLISYRFDRINEGESAVFLAVGPSFRFLINSNNQEIAINNNVIDYESGNINSKIFFALKAKFGKSFQIQYSDKRKYLILTPSVSYSFPFTKVENNWKIQTLQFGISIQNTFFNRELDSYELDPNKYHF